MRLGILPCVLLSSSGCVSNAVRMETGAIPRKNPTVYQFDLPLEVLRERVMAGLAEQHKKPIFGRHQWPEGPAIFDVTESGKYRSWLKVLELPGNERDLYLHASHVPLWESPIYRGPDGGLPFLAEFHVHFCAMGPAQTVVSVTALKTEVLNGSTWGIGSCGPGTFNRYVLVEPTSIEEYVILRYMGDILGAPSMPGVILPK
jgi:hypothetical protein